MNYDYARQVEIQVPVDRHGVWSEDRRRAHELGSIVKKHESADVIGKMTYYRLYNGKFLCISFVRRPNNEFERVSGLYYAMSELPMRLREAMENREVLDIGVEW